MSIFYMKLNLRNLLYVIRESANNLSPAFNLTVDTFKGIIGAYAHPVFYQKVHVGEGFFDAFINLFGSQR